MNLRKDLNMMVNLIERIHIVNSAWKSAQKTFPDFASICDSLAIIKDDLQVELLSNYSDQIILHMDVEVLGDFCSIKFRDGEIGSFTDAAHIPTHVVKGRVPDIFDRFLGDRHDTNP